MNRGLEATSPSSQRAGTAPPRLGADWLFNRILGYWTLPKTQLQLPILFNQSK